LTKYSRHHSEELPLCLRPIQLHLTSTQPRSHHMTPKEPSTTSYADNKAKTGSRMNGKIATKLRKILQLFCLLIRKPTGVLQQVYSDSQDSEKPLKTPTQTSQTPCLPLCTMDFVQRSQKNLLTQTIDTQMSTSKMAR